MLRGRALNGKRKVFWVVERPESAVLCVGGQVITRVERVVWENMVSNDQGNNTRPRKAEVKVSRAVDDNTALCVCGFTVALATNWCLEIHLNRASPVVFTRAVKRAASHT